MWYVMQVFTGLEDQAVLYCNERVSKEVLDKCFIPRHEVKIRRKGKWNIEEKVLFPGYVFVITDHVEDLQQQLLHRIPDFTKIIGKNKDLISLTESEISFLQRFGGEEQIVKMSTGVIEGDKIIVFEGPLTGMEGYIKKIDRHKRKAWIEVEMFGTLQKAEVGLEIVKKWDRE